MGKHTPNMSDEMNAVQSYSMSAVETATSTTIGFVVSMALTHWVLPYMTGYDPTVGMDLLIVVTYTVASFIRSYLVRRAFA
jgi:hypothetical protein|tara:strand:+ start:178 stop:420 length:243 start_codon:yes stop_codon:yes gene_type:complete